MTSNRTKLIHKYAKGLKVVEVRFHLWSFPPRRLIPKGEATQF